MGHDSNLGPKWTIVDWWKTVNVLKPIIGNDTDCELMGWTLEDFGRNGASTFLLIINWGERDKRTKWSVCKQILNKPLLRLRSKTHWNQTFYPQWSRHCGHKRPRAQIWRGVILTLGEYALAKSGLWQRNLESPPRLDLGTINIQIALTVFHHLR